MNIKDLHRPFDPENVSWRIGSITKDKTRGLALAYLDARDVMERLDEVCGPANWQSDCYDAGDGRLACKLGIRIDGEWVWKCDGAGGRESSERGLSENDVSKASFSDAFKRAAVLWGVGRYLYDLQSPWVAVDQYKKIKPDEYEKLTQVLRGAKVPDTETKANSRDEQQAFVDEIRKQGDLDCLCDFWDASKDKLRSLPADWRPLTFIEFVRHGIDLAESVGALNEFLKAYAKSINGISDEQKDALGEEVNKRRSFLSQTAV
jgi:hypothetical protein